MQDSKQTNTIGKFFKDIFNPESAEKLELPVRLEALDFKKKTGIPQGLQITLKRRGKHKFGNIQHVVKQQAIKYYRKMNRNTTMARIRTELQKASNRRLWMENRHKRSNVL